jgi:hypothetical protein
LRIVRSPVAPKIVMMHGCARAPWSPAAAELAADDGAEEGVATVGEMVLAPDDTTHSWIREVVDD